MRATASWRCSSAGRLVWLLPSTSLGCGKRATAATWATEAAWLRRRSASGTGCSGSDRRCRLFLRFYDSCYVVRACHRRLHVELAQSCCTRPAALRNHGLDGHSVANQLGRGRGAPFSAGDNCASDGACNVGQDVGDGVGLQWSALFERVDEQWREAWRPGMALKHRRKWRFGLWCRRWRITLDVTGQDVGGQQCSCRRRFLTSAVEQLLGDSLALGVGLRDAQKHGHFEGGVACREEAQSIVVLDVVQRCCYPALAERSVLWQRLRHPHIGSCELCNLTGA